MRVGYLVPEFPSQTHAFFWREITEIRSLGHEVVLYSTRTPGAGASRHDFAQRAATETTYLASAIGPGLMAFFHWLRPSSAGKVLRYIRSCRPRSLKDSLKLVVLATVAMRLAALARRERLDHLHAHSCADAAHLIAMQSLLTGIPYSLTLHGDLPVYGRHHKQKMARAAFVATVTKPLQEDVMQLMGWTRDRVPVIQMGVDTGRFHSRPVSRREAADCIVLLTIARLNPTKGHLIALEAVRDVLDRGIDVRYLIAGAGPARAEIESVTRQFELQDAVEILGTVSEQTVVELLQEADIFVLPSFGLGEAAPVAVMEAMSCGLAVISTRIGGTPDMIEQGRTGVLVPQRDAVALGEAIADLAEDRARRDTLGQAASAYARTAFDYRQNARQLIAMWQH